MIVGMQAVAVVEGRGLAALTEDAAELREIAGKLRVAAASALGVLDRVVRLDTSASWEGPWATECGATIEAWRAAAADTAAQLARRAAVIDAHARDLEDRAATLATTMATAG
jgi:hypothetical protein